MAPERRLDQWVHPMLDGPPQRQAGDRDPDLRAKRQQMEPIERLAGQLGRPVALLGELIDLGRPAP